MTTTCTLDTSEQIVVRVPATVELNRLHDRLHGDYYAWRVVIDGKEIISSYWVSLCNLRKPRTRRGALVQARAMLFDKLNKKVKL